ncbi:MAG: hypothetical protein ACLRI8_03740 [Agathobacter rectalis]
MRAKTRIFGEIDIPQDKIITMEKGMIGFSELKNYTLIYNSERMIRSLSCGFNRWMMEILHFLS